MDTSSDRQTSLELGRDGRRPTDTEITDSERYRGIARDKQGHSQRKIEKHSRRLQRGFTE